MEKVRVWVFLQLDVQTLVGYLLCARETAEILKRSHLWFLRPMPLVQGSVGWSLRPHKPNSGVGFDSDSRYTSSVITGLFHLMELLQLPQYWSSNKSQHGEAERCRMKLLPSLSYLLSLCLSASSLAPPPFLWVGTEDEIRLWQMGQLGQKWSRWRQILTCVFWVRRCWRNGKSIAAQVSERMQWYYLYIYIFLVIIIIIS